MLIPTTCEWIRLLSKGEFKLILQYIMLVIGGQYNPKGSYNWNREAGKEAAVMQCDEN